VTGKGSLPEPLSRERGYADGVSGRSCEPEYRLVNGLFEYQKGYVDYRLGYLEGLSRRHALCSSRGDMPAERGRPLTRFSKSDQAADVMMLALVTALVWPVAIILLGTILGLAGVQPSQTLLLWLVILAPPAIILVGHLLWSWMEMGASGPLLVVGYYVGLPVLVGLAAFVVFMFIEFWPVWLISGSVIYTIRRQLRGRQKDRTES
jgi:hypothetical protein